MPRCNQCPICRSKADAVSNARPRRRVRLGALSVGGVSAHVGNSRCTGLRATVPGRVTQDEGVSRFLAHTVLAFVDVTVRCCVAICVVQLGRALSNVVAADGD